MTYLNIFLHISWRHFWQTVFSFSPILRPIGALAPCLPGSPQSVVKRLSCGAEDLESGAWTCQQFCWTRAPAPDTGLMDAQTELGLQAYWGTGRWLGRMQALLSDPWSLAWCSASGYHRLLALSLSTRLIPRRKLFIIFPATGPLFTPAQPETYIMQSEACTASTWGDRERHQSHC